MAYLGWLKQKSYRWRVTWATSLFATCRSVWQKTAARLMTRYMKSMSPTPSHMTYFTNGFGFIGRWSGWGLPQWKDSWQKSVNMTSQLTVWGWKSKRSLLQSFGWLKAVIVVDPQSTLHMICRSMLHRDGPTYMILHMDDLMIMSMVMAGKATMQEEALRLDESDISYATETNFVGMKSWNGSSAEWRNWGWGRNKLPPWTEAMNPQSVHIHYTDYWNRQQIRYGNVLQWC